MFLHEVLEESSEVRNDVQKTLEVFLQYGANVRVQFFDLRLDLWKIISFLEQIFKMT